MLPTPSAFATHWRLDPNVVFLNHGSFGACPRAVLEVQTEWQQRMEREPVLFLHRELEALLDEARHALAEFVGCAADDLAFVPNATTGVNVVLRSLRWQRGDELLVTDHEYNASRNVLDFAADNSGARVVVAKIPFAVSGPEAVVDAVLARVTDRTKLLLVDHVTSPTGIVMPVARLAAVLRDRGIETLVDGAHGPGMLPLQLEQMGAAYYTGNCHKWLCSPKGAALLYVRRDRQAGLRPMAISHGANSTRSDRSRFRLEFDFTGTADYSPFLCVPAALRFLASLLPGGFEALRAHNHALALRGRTALCNALGVPPPVPPAMIGSLAAVELPSDDEAPTPLGLDPLQVRLFDRHRIEVPIMRWPSPRLRLLRISAQIYNSDSQFEYLARALATELSRRADP